MHQHHRSHGSFARTGKGSIGAAIDIGPFGTFDAMVGAVPFARKLVGFEDSIAPFGVDLQGVAVDIDPMAAESVVGWLIGSEDIGEEKLQPQHSSSLIACVVICDD